MEGKTQSPVQVMRVIKGAFVVSALMLIYIAFKVMVQPQQPASQQFEIAIALVGISSVIAGWFLPRSLLRGAEREPQNMPPQAQLQRWFTMSVLGLAFFEACVLFGFVLHVLGGRDWLVGLLFGVGIAAELFLTPGEPPAADADRSIQA
jgi:hypothetical protein